MATKSFKLEYALINKYQGNYAAKYAKRIDVNKYKEKWALSSLIDDYGFDTVSECLDYYFKTNKEGHPLSYFFFNFEQLKNMMDDQKNDEAMRLERRMKTQQLVKEYLDGV